MGKLKELRIQAGMSQAELAQKTKISSSHISRLENDPLIRIRPKLLKKLAAALECTEEEVWKSPVAVLDEEGKELARGELALLRAYMKFGRPHRRKLVEIMRKINEREENEEQEKANARQSTEKRKPDP